MTPEIKEHLIKVEAAIQATKPLLSLHSYPDDLRTVIVIGFIDQAIEHHETMLLLISSDMVGSAFALARSIVEAMYRGLWINASAKESEVDRFAQKDEIRPTMTELAKAIDDTYHVGPFFEDLKRRSWDALNSYTHTGMLQLGRRFTGHQLKPAYTDKQIFEITTVVTTCVLILVSRFFAAQKHPDECTQTERLLESYGPAASQKP